MTSSKTVVFCNQTKKYPPNLNVSVKIHKSIKKIPLIWINIFIKKIMGVFTENVDLSCHHVDLIRDTF